MSAAHNGTTKRQKRQRSEMTARIHGTRASAKRSSAGPPHHERRRQQTLPPPPHPPRAKHTLCSSLILWLYAGAFAS
eukprot:210973-Pleurochrysis_carterae.AAC.1